MKKAKRVVIKVGTNVITTSERTLDKDRIEDLVSQISDARDKGAEVLLVTSGAIGAGTGLLGLKSRPKDLAGLQAAASVGQSHLMHLYSEYFKSRGYIVGQILLTQEDFDDRKRYLNIKHTILALLSHGAIPVINENDTVSTDEIRCGDNDKIAGLVSDISGADKLMLLTDVDGLLDEDGRVITQVPEITQKISKLAGSKSGCEFGTGGMATKIKAARSVASAGIECVIANGRKKDIISKILAGEDVGTTFRSGGAKFIAKKRWIAYSSKPKGAVRVDNGAVLAVSMNDKSLLASGLLAVEGNFSSGDVVSIADKDGREFARGVVNYSSKELSKIKGLKSKDYKSALGYKGRDEAIHKDNLAIL